MADIQKTNVCCFDLTDECIDYLKSLDLNVYDGTLGSVLSLNWMKIGGYRTFIRPDYRIPANIHEYHVFIADTAAEIKREYDLDEHKIREVEDVEKRYLSCDKPVSVLDLRPFGGYVFNTRLKSGVKRKRIEIVFLGPFAEVAYYSDVLPYCDRKLIGTFSNYGTWGILKGSDKYGERIKLEDIKLSRTLFEGRKYDIKYYQTFIFPTRWDDEGERVSDPHYISLLKNEDDECISYVYCSDEGSVKFVFPQLVDKASFIKDLFENFIFVQLSDFFPDVEAKRWIHQPVYDLPEEKKIRDIISEKKKQFEVEISELEKQAEEISKKEEFYKLLLTGTGTQLVHAVKKYLEWLGFADVVDKDDAIEDGDIKEEDLYFKYKDQLVLLEIKGINGTSTDAECSQVDKIVSRRMKQLKTTEVHGVYIVNNQRNVEPLSRQMPPFNENQISDAVNQDRALIYTAQLFSLYSDIDNGYVTKESARSCFLQKGIANFHFERISLGVPYDYYQKDTIICIELNGIQVSVGNIIYYKDELNKLVACKVESIQRDKEPLDSASSGRVGIKVDHKVPRNKELFL